MTFRVYPLRKRALPWSTCRSMVLLLKASADKLRAAAKDAGKDSEKEAEEVIQKVETHEEAAPNAKPSPLTPDRR